MDTYLTTHSHVARAMELLHAFSESGLDMSPRFLHTNRRSLHLVAYQLLCQYRSLTNPEMLILERDIKRAEHAFYRTLPAYPLKGDTHAFVRYAAAHEPLVYQSIKTNDVYVDTGANVENFLQRLADPDNDPEEVLNKTFKHATGVALQAQAVEMYLYATNRSPDTYAITILHDDAHARTYGSFRLIKYVADALIAYHAKFDFYKQDGDSQQETMSANAYIAYRALWERVCNKVNTAKVPDNAFQPKVTKLHP